MAGIWGDCNIQSYRKNEAILESAFILVNFSKLWNYFSKLWNLIHKAISKLTFLSQKEEEEGGNPFMFLSGIMLKKNCSKD